MGSGLTFMPLPIDSTAVRTVGVSWDLSGAPEGTRAVWTFGEGLGTGTKVGLPASVLANCGYAVGGLGSWRCASAAGGRGGDEGKEDDGFGVYYFGQLPRCIANVVGAAEELFKHRFLL